MSVTIDRSVSNQDNWQFIFACVLALSLMVLDEQTHLMFEVRIVIATLMQPIQWAANIPETWFIAGKQALNDKASLSKEAERLRLELLLLNQRLQQSEQVKAENDRLRMLLGVSARVNEGRFLVSLVTNHNTDPYRQIMRIDKGSKDHLAVGTPVMDAQGLMGQVMMITHTESDVLLLTDLAFQVPVRVVRTGARGIVQGQGNNEMSLKFIPTSLPIREGDMLETSGLDGHFPSGIPVAEVVAVKSQAGSVFWQVTAQPIAKLGTSREVLLLQTTTQPMIPTTEP